MPYFVLTILLIRGCFLPGSYEGIVYFITPNVERLGDPQVVICNYVLMIPASDNPCVLLLYSNLSSRVQFINNAEMC